MPCQTISTGGGMLSSADKKGIALCVLSTACIALQDVISKTLLSHFSIAQIIFVRHIVFTLFALWWLQRRGGGLRSFFAAYRRAASVKIQLLRSSLMVIEIAVFFYGLRYIGVAQAHAVFMLFPILATLLAWLLLGETLTKRKIIALLLGFIGAMLIIRPVGNLYEPGTLIILGAALLFALYNVITRFATARDGFDVSMVYMATVALAWSAPAGILNWQTGAEAEIWLLLGGVTVVGIVVHLLIVKSLEYAPASLLQPFNYTLIGWALLFSWIFYNEVLDKFHILGILTVLAGGLYLSTGKQSKNNTAD